MKFKKNKSALLYLEWNNPMQQYRLEADWIGSCFLKIKLQVLVDMSQQCVLAVEKANSIPGCVGKELSQKAEGIDFCDSR